MGWPGWGSPGTLKDAFSCRLNSRPSLGAVCCYHCVNSLCGDISGAVVEATACIGASKNGDARSLENKVGALNAGQLFAHSGYFRMKRMTHDHSLKPEKRRILSEAEPALA